MHITSLPSRHGIGTLGEEAHHFVDFLKRAGQRYWQILPLNPAGYGDSPYLSVSSRAGNPFLIDLDILYEAGLLKGSDFKNEMWGEDIAAVDYKKIHDYRMAVLKFAVNRAQGMDDRRFDAFCEKHACWLNDYASYMLIRETEGGRPWNEWSNGRLARHDEAEISKFNLKRAKKLHFYKYLQYLFYKQWRSLKRHAARQGIKIIGDMPFYVAMDSADVWASSANFLLDGSLKPLLVTGTPPDSFCAEGQCWGHPVYDWKKLAEDDFGWWIARLKHAASMYDAVRLDHFRAIESYYVIDPANTAGGGRWEPGPGKPFIDAIKAELGNFTIIAEDLGYITDEVKKLVRYSGFSGMKVLQYAFDSREPGDYLPHNYGKNSVVYSGTHDNPTIKGWFDEASAEDTQFAVDYAALTRKEGYVRGMLRLMYMSPARLAIAQMQDVLGLAGWARMNTPSTVGGNWKWRANKRYGKKKLARALKKMSRLYQRR